MSIAAFTQLHVIISLAGLASGLVVAWGMLTARALPGWHALFLATTWLTSVTGFLFPLKQVGPPHVVGAVSLVVLAIATVALYGRRLAGSWRATYVVTAMIALYLNGFVAVVQLFLKQPFFTALAPTQTEPPFLAAQALTLAAAILLTALALRRFRSP